MELHYSSAPALEAECDVLAVSVFTEPEKDSLVKALDKALDGRLSAQIEAERFKGRSGTALRIYTDGALDAGIVVLVGGGKKQDFSPPDVRNFAARASRLAARTHAETVVFVVPQHPPSKREAVLQFAAEGAHLGRYTFSKYKNEKNEQPGEFKTFTVATERGTKSKKSTAAQTRKANEALIRGTAVAAAIAHARDMVNEPAEVMSPSEVASRARAIARKHKSVTTKVLGAKECEKLGMGMFLSVGRGSAQEPKLVHMTYKPAKKAKKRLVFIGKGVTFDSGGYSLKPTQAMEDMKIDMAGAAAVVSAMDAIAELGSPHEVHCITAAAENMVSGNAYKLGDVLHAMDGTTVEINNTDAEGRLTLGDAITYAREKIKPDQIFDFATLTGACIIALGPYTAGVMSKDESLIKTWLSTCDTAGEDVWRLPLPARLKEQLKSPIADLKNAGGREGGSLTAGLFLSHFAKDTPFVHTDIAGPSSATRDQGAVTRGGTGFAVAAIVEYATRVA